MSPGCHAATTWANRLIPVWLQVIEAEPIAAAAMVLMPPEVVAVPSFTQRCVWAAFAARLPSAWPLPKMSTSHEFAATVVTLVGVMGARPKFELNASGAPALTFQRPTAPASPPSIAAGKVTTTLCAPVAGEDRYQRLTQSYEAGAAVVACEIFVRATAL